MFSITGSLADVRLIICLTKLILSSGNEGRALSTARAGHVKHSLQLSCKKLRKHENDLTGAKRKHMVMPKDNYFFLSLFVFFSRGKELRGEGRKLPI